MHLDFDNTFVRHLPADPERSNHRRQVRGACYSRVDATPVSAPQRVAHASEVAELIGLSAGDCENETFAEVFAGNRSLPGMETYAACYGGHQFGNWAGQLGDGRAISLGEAVHRGQRWELQLKGAGPTPYSRSADGRAVMRSSVREFLCSEAMHHLGVPTTRALSLVATGDSVVRDMFYDGNPQPEPGAIVCRVAPSFLRFGNFEILASRREHELLKQLADYAIT
ncbi:MAG: protein adenylyltransferase SelO family protein, partial [Acidobacteriota bacterium]